MPSKILCITGPTAVGKSRLAMQLCKIKKQNKFQIISMDSAQIYKGVDISSACSAAEHYLALANCPTIAIGDGGNEVGMGNAVTALSSLNIQPAVSTVDELIVADVSNWAAYALCALTDWLSGHTSDSMTLFHGDLEMLVARGAIDGVTLEPTATEDGFPLSDTTALISDIAQLLSKGHVA